MHARGKYEEKNAYFAGTSGIAFFIAGRWFDASVYKMRRGESEGCLMKFFGTTALHFMTCAAYP